MEYLLKGLNSLGKWVKIYYSSDFSGPDGNPTLLGKFLQDARIMAQQREWDASLAALDKAVNCVIDDILGIIDEHDIECILFVKSGRWYVGQLFDKLREKILSNRDLRDVTDLLIDNGKSPDYDRKSISKVRNRYEIRGDLNGCRLLIIDNVAETGNTMLGVASRAFEAGASYVVGYALCKAMEV